MDERQPIPEAAAFARPRDRLALAAFVVTLAIFWFATLGTRTLISPDEGRYASLALGMLQTGDWVTPRLNGLLYFEKPALQYWLGALFFHLWGVSEFTARLWPALSGLLTAAVTGYTAGRLWGRESGVQALAIAASTTWIVGNSHFLTLDAGLTFFLTVSLCAMLLAHQAGQSARSSRRWIWLAWAAMAGAVLSKGLVGIVIPGATLVLLCLWQRDWTWWRLMHWASGLLIFVVLCAPWFVLVSMRNPGFAQFFFIHEHFARYLTPGHHREGAWWYYVPLLLGGMLPWTGALPWLGGLASGARSMANAPGVAAGEATTQRRVLLAWSAFIFLFFSVSDSKLPSYILPMFPALALLVTLELRHASRRALKWHLLVPALLWIAVLLLSTQAHRFASLNTPVSVLAPLASAFQVGALLFGVGAAVAWWCLARSRITPAVLCVALAHAVATLLVLQSHNGFGQLKSAAELAQLVHPYLAPQTPFFAVQSYDQTLPFYLRRNVTLVDYEDEFALGQRAEPGKSVPTLDAFVQQWQQLPKAAAYMGRATWFVLQQQGLPMRIVYQDPRRLVVVKP